MAMLSRVAALTVVFAALAAPSAEAAECRNSARTAAGNPAFAVAPNGRSYIYLVNVTGATCSRLRRTIGIALAAMPHEKGRITYRVRVDRVTGGDVQRFRCRGNLQEGTPSGVLFGEVRCVRGERRFRFSYTD